MVQTVGKDIRRRRRSLDLTQYDLAEKAKVPQAVISLIESEKRLQEYRERLMAALDEAEREHPQAIAA